MRIFKQTISILLAAQLLVSFGLCGGLCCVKAAGLSAPKVAEQAAESDENLPPCHRKKAAEKAASQQKQATHRTQAAQPASPQHQSSVNKNLPTLLNRDCCLMKTATPTGEPLPGVAMQQSEKLVATLKTSLWSDSQVAVDSSPIPIQNFTAHSPPYIGFQLSLRI